MEPSELCYRQLCDKICKIIDSAEPKQRRTVARYVCLANRQLHKVKGEYTWGVIGASLAIEQRFKKKFGYFKVEKEPIKL